MKVKKFAEGDASRDYDAFLYTYVNDALKLTEEPAPQISPQHILMKMSPTFVCP